jgi:hypothetical protein
LVRRACGRPAGARRRIAQRCIQTLVHDNEGRLFRVALL